MAIRKPLVLVGGQIEQLQSADSISIGDLLLQLTNNSASPIVFGMPVASAGTGNSDKVVPAQANASATKQVVGFVNDASIAASAAGSIAVTGIITASSTGLWDAIAGTTGGLTPGAVYYLDAATAGHITATAPTTAGQYVIPLMVAISTLEARIAIGSDVLL